MLQKNNNSAMSRKFKAKVVSLLRRPIFIKWWYMSTRSR